MTESWQDMLKRLSWKLHAPNLAASEAPVSFSTRRKKKLSWNLFLCGRSR